VSGLLCSTLKTKKKLFQKRGFFNPVLLQKCLKKWIRNLCQCRHIQVYSHRPVMQRSNAMTSLLRFWVWSPEVGARARNDRPSPSNPPVKYWGESTCTMYMYNKCTDFNDLHIKFQKCSRVIAQSPHTGGGRSSPRRSGLSVPPSLLPHSPPQKKMDGRHRSCGSNSLLAQERAGLYRYWPTSGSNYMDGGVCA